MPTYYRNPTNNMLTAFETVRAYDCHAMRLKDVSIVVKSVVSEDKEGDLVGDPLKLPNGQPVLGKISITSLEERSSSPEPVDVRVLLNGNRWGGLTTGEQNYVIDTCLTRIDVQIEDGRTKRDDLDRPVLKKKPWGYLFCGFDEVDGRHGVSSIGAQAIARHVGKHGQLYMTWLDTPPPEDFMPIPAKRPKRPNAAIKDGEPDEYARGKLSARRVAERVEELTELATMLGVLQLEFAASPKGPRDEVDKAIRAKIIRWTAIEDYMAVRDGRTPSVEPDLAAGVLVTSKARPSLDLLDRTVPECRDALVLKFVLDDEGEDDPREEVLEVVNRRIRELG